MLDKYTHLIAFVAITALALAAHYLGAPTEIMAPIYLALSAAVVQLAKHSEPPKPGGGAGVGLTSLLVALLALSSCSPLKSANDARLWLCDNLGEQQKSAIAAQAAKQGVPFDVLYLAWRAQCLIRMQRAGAEAVGAIGTVKP